MVLVREQPQTAALVLSALEPARAAPVMDFIPEKARTGIIRRMASIELGLAEVLREVGQALSHELRTAVAEGMRKVDGKTAALELLRRVSSEQQNEVVTQLEKEDPSLAAHLRTRLFTFEDLKSISDRDLKTLLKDLDTNQLAVALEGRLAAAARQVPQEPLQPRRADAQRRPAAAMGALRLSVVEKAQSDIAKAALALAEQERITLVGPADRMV